MSASIDCDFTTRDPGVLRLPTEQVAYQLARGGRMHGPIGHAQRARAGMEERAPERPDGAVCGTPPGPTHANSIRPWHGL